MTDFLPSVLEHNPIVIGERVAGLPWTFGDTQIPKSKFTSLVDLDSRVVEVPSRAEQPAETRIAQQIVERIPNGATLQFGIGGVPDAVLRGLANHKDIGIHTGILTEPAQALIESGVVTNRFKGIDEGQTITAYLAGTQAFYDFCERHPALQVKQLEYTHNPSTLLQIQNLISINSAFEVDLTGQVNAETVGGRYWGQVGGQVDFIRGAAASSGGLSIIGLSSTDRRETLSRIVPALDGGTVTSLRTDMDLIVTEYGVAQLRGRSMGERIDAMITISHPKFRDQLRQASRRL
jgi:acyl-CoA hydrolase